MHQVKAHYYTQFFYTRLNEIQQNIVLIGGLTKKIIFIL